MKNKKQVIARSRALRTKLIVALSLNRVPITNWVRGWIALRADKYTEVK